MGQIPGELFTPVFSTTDEFSEGYKQSTFFVDKEFYREYRKHIAALSHTAACAKIFVLNNWEKITDWSKLNVSIRDNSGKTTEYYNYVPSDRKTWGKRGKSDAVQKLLKDMEFRRSKKHNPVNELFGVVLDPTDGDFSLTINKKDHLWIDDESVIIIADYIEKNLNTNANA